MAAVNEVDRHPPESSRGRFYVESFGALGDGVTDDTASLLACFTAAANACGVAHLSPGRTYRYSSITAELAGFDVWGPRSTLLSALPVATSSPGMWFWGGDIGFSGIKFSHVTPLDIDADGAQIYANGSNASTLRFGYPGVSSIVGPVTVEDCEFENSRNTALYVDGATEAYSRRNKGRENGQGVCFVNITERGEMAFNDFERCLDDMYVVLADASVPGRVSKNIKILFNHGRYGYAQGIDTSGIDGGIIMGNDIDMTWGAGILCYEYTGVGPTGPSWNTKVTKNDIRNSGRYFGAGQYRTSAGAGGNGIRFSDTLNCSATDNDIWDSYGAPFYDGGGNTGMVVRGNPGYNPVGSIGSPAIPASNVELVNPFGIDALVFIYGGTINAIKVGGDPTGGASQAAYTIPAGQSISIDYSVAPGWNWFLS